MTAVPETRALDGVAAEPSRVLPPDPFTIFEKRARRFERLADGHALGDWLRFLARLSALQQQALREFPSIPSPDATTLALARDHAMPPLPGRSWPRDAAWRQVLRDIAAGLMADAPAAARAVLAELSALPDDALEARADRVLRLELAGDRVASLPFVAAALQVYWTYLAAGVGAEQLAPLDVAGICPCCGTLPVASMLHPGGLRYLHCALCGVEWNLVRVKCAACESTAGIGYRQIEGGSGVVRAETCDSCKSYLKIVRADRDPDADPVADDLATLALDLLVDEAGYRRAGPNLLLALGDA